MNRIQLRDGVVAILRGKVSGATRHALEALLGCSLLSDFGRRVCRWCGVGFVARRRNQLSCSEVCTVSHHNAASYERYVAKHGGKG